MNQRGDTLIEVILAVTVFSIVAVGGMAVMNQGVATAQRSLEIGLVRAQMDAQADALRYMHEAYVSSLGSGVNSEARTVWNEVAARHAVVPASAQSFSDASDGEKCQMPAPAANGSSDGQAFAIDTRRLDGANSPNAPAGTISLLPVIPFDSSNWGSSRGFMPVSSSAVGFPETYAQIRYGDMNNPTTPAVAQGIWIQAVRTVATPTELGYVDFNIRACWQTPGQTLPVTLGTVVRLYEPAV